jgi:hypothetical protein
MKSNTNAQSNQQPLERNPALKQLQVLVGEWKVEVVLPSASFSVIEGYAIFEWIEDGHFLAYRSGVSQSDFPTGTSIIGGDGTMGSYTMLYYDSRGVSRIYQMSLSNEVWKLWRNDPEFAQRLTGTFSDDGNTITAAWEKSIDGSTWELDFDVTYRKHQ